MASAIPAGLFNLKVDKMFETWEFEITNKHEDEGKYAKCGGAEMERHRTEGGWVPDGSIMHLNQSQQLPGAGFL